MPRFILFGKQQSTGSDDLLVPIAVEAIATGSWLTAFGYVYYQQQESLTSCTDGSSMEGLFAGGLIFTGLNLGLLIIVIRNTLRGTIINTWPRRTVARWMTIKHYGGSTYPRHHLFYLKAVLSGAQTVGLTLASKWILYDAFNCDEVSSKALTSAVKTLWIPSVISFYTCGSLLVAGTQVLIDKHRMGKGTDMQTDTGVLDVLRKTWSYRISQLSRLLGLEGNAEFMKLGSVFATVFYEAPEIVSSDVAASFIMLGDRHQDTLERLKNDETELCNTLTNPDRTSCKLATWMSVGNAAHYMKFALANYGWTHYIYTSTYAFMGFLRIYLRGRYIPRRCPSHIIDDNSFLGNTTAISMATGIPFDDFVHVSFRNELYEIPFFVTLDHEKKSVVVSVRGTMSMKDVIVDLISFAECLSLAHVADAQAHEGMHASAKVILRKLTEGDSPILQQATAKLEKQVGKQQAKDYQLVITGHSLGAGVAAILAILLREVEAYKHLICFPFSPPGGLLSIEAARYSEEFTCSVIIEDDIVGRLGLTNIYKLKLMNLDVIQNLDIPKHKALAKPFERFFAKLLKPRQNDSSGHKYSWEGNHEASKMVEEFQAGIEKAKRVTKEELAHHRQLYPPGELRSYFSRGDSSMFQNILLCNNMVLHHMPIVVLRSLRRIHEQGTMPRVI